MAGASRLQVAKQQQLQQAAAAANREGRTLTPADLQAAAAGEAEQPAPAVQVGGAGGRAGRGRVRSVRERVGCLATQELQGIEWMLLPAGPAGRRASLKPPVRTLLPRAHASPLLYLLCLLSSPARRSARPPEWSSGSSPPSPACAPLPAAPPPQQFPPPFLPPPLAP